MAGQRINNENQDKNIRNYDTDDFPGYSSECWTIQRQDMKRLF